MNVRQWTDTTARWLNASASILLADTAEAERQAAAAADWRVDSPGEYCPRCGAGKLSGEATREKCRQCDKQSVPWDRVVRLSEYEGPMGRWIPAMKFHGQWGWARWFGRELAERINEPTSDRVVVCPVPMHWLRRWQRGFNQSHVIAETIASARGWPVVSLLRRTRFTPPQTSIPTGHRHANVAKSIAADCIDLAGWRVWLVDDVKTTGSTARTCCRLLKQMGARSVGVAVAAVTEA